MVYHYKDSLFYLFLKLVQKKYIFSDNLRILYTSIYSPKTETEHVKKYNLFQIFNIILNTEISVTLH